MMKLIRMVDDWRMNGKLLNEVEQFKYLKSHNASGGEMDEDVEFIMNEVGRVCRGNKVLKYKSLQMGAKRSLYEGIVVKTLLCEAET